MAPSDSKSFIELNVPAPTPTNDDFPDGGLRAWLVVLGVCFFFLLLSKILNLLFSHRVALFQRAFDLNLQET